jgi:hypothetical protein
MEEAKVPIAYEKCYAGRLTEFAGKTYTKHGLPFLTPDANVLTWQSLYDYQAATGVLIPWNHLPLNIRKRIIHKTKGIKLSGQCLYEWSQKATVYHRGTSSFEENLKTTFLSEYFRFSFENNEIIASPKRSTGIVRHGNELVVTNKLVNRGGYFHRYSQTTLPDWFKQKFRPVSSDKVLHSTISALIEMGSVD